MKLHDVVVLAAPLPAYGLKEKDSGTIVYVYEDGRGCEVEFATADGPKVITLLINQVARKS